MKANQAEVFWDEQEKWFYSLIYQMSDRYKQTKVNLICLQEKNKDFECRYGCISGRAE